MSAGLIFALIVCVEVGFSLACQGVTGSTISRKRGRREGKERGGRKEEGLCVLWGFLKGILLPSRHLQYRLTKEGPCECARMST